MKSKTKPKAKIRTKVKIDVPEHVCGDGFSKALKQKKMFYIEPLCPVCWEDDITSAKNGRLKCDVCNKKIDFISAKGLYVDIVSFNGNHISNLNTEDDRGRKVCSKICADMLILQSM